eukprot:CAMPEP_0174841386 /NCGR_PEP_ID=MMETSP1114-20130205/9280_1 /TAXON_ID=312471 /ORGANISM="Neobodo designis, Strain CCAP 1951/1" /LENGTH=83 /DNA_ID=CAMNT_0016075567 /DNA_START=109 /DNA_END=356 /DNA_ORIENTATION=+
MRRQTNNINTTPATAQPSPAATATKQMTTTTTATTTMAARDMRGVPDLPPLKVLLQAIAAVHHAAIPHANAEQQYVDRARRHR